MPPYRKNRSGRKQKKTYKWNKKSKQNLSRRRKRILGGGEAVRFSNNSLLKPMDQNAVDYIQHFNDKSLTINIIYQGSIIQTIKLEGGDNFKQKVRKIQELSFYAIKKQLIKNKKIENDATDDDVVSYVNNDDAIDSEKFAVNVDYQLEIDIVEEK